MNKIGIPIHLLRDVSGRTLKILSMMVLVMTVNFNAHTAIAMQGNQISIKEESIDLEDLIWKIEESSDYKFVYNAKHLKEYKDLKVNEKGSVEDVLNEVLKDTDLTYVLRSRTFVLKKLERSPKPQEEESKKIKGKVTDEKGEALPGVSVVLKGTTHGVSTDLDGKFVLNLPQNNSGILVVSFIGLETQEVRIADQQSINITLKASSEALQEVVVTGYGSRSKESYTGSAVTIEGDQLLQTNSNNLLLSLQAVEPSFVMLENLEAGSNPNALPEFQIRGSASVPGLESEYKGNPNMPLFMLDGFEAEPSVIFDMDPNRVKSFTILKDASATAIYGSRGANGVVVVETHAPKKGKMRVSYNMDLSLTAADLTDYNLLNAEEKLQLEKDAGHYKSDRDGAPVDVVDKYKEIYNKKLKDIREGVDTYWLSKPLKDQINHKHSLNLEGGEDTFRYGMDLSYHKNDGVMIGSGRDRYSIGVTLQYRVEKFTFKNSLTYYNVNSTNSPYGSFSDYAIMNPYLRYKDENGKMLYVVDKTTDTRDPIYNPLYNGTLNIVDESEERNFRNNFAVDWSINTKSTLRGSISISQKSTSSDKFLPAKHTSFAKYGGDDIARKGSYDITNGKVSKIEASLTYTYMMKKNKNMFYLSTTGNIMEEKFDSYSFGAEGFPSEDMNHISYARQYLKSKRPGGTEYVSRSLGWLGTLNYSYDNRYFADVSYRFDASSRFGADNRWAPFGSAGIGWNVHNEAFAKDSRVLSKLKLRASYGLTGSQNFDPYQAMTTYKLYNETRYHYGYGFVMKALGNEELKWQRTLKTNVGFDTELFNNRFSLSVNLYKDVSKDVLVPVSLPTSLGFSTYMENLGEIENKGYELQARVFVIKKPGVSFSLFASAIHNKNKLKKLSNNLMAINEELDKSFDGTADIYDDKKTVNRPKVRYIEGESSNAIWAVRSLGIDPANGKEIYLDKDGNKTYTWNAKDQVAVGCEDADLTGNFGANLFYKGFHLNMNFNYRLGGEMYNQTLVDRVENANMYKNVDKRVLEQRWRKPGDQAVFKDVKLRGQTKPTSRFVEEYNYLSLSSLNVAYDFNADKLPMERLKLMFTMNDVFRTSSVEVERGLSYPFARTFTFTLQTTF